MAPLFAQKISAQSFAGLAIVFAFLTLPGCSNQPSTRAVNNVTTDHTRFETAIAEKILGETIQTVPFLPVPQRLKYLQGYLRQFETGVDLTRVSSRIRREGVLLRYLTEAEAALATKYGFGARVQKLSSLTWSEAEFETRFNQEMERITQRLLAQNPDSSIGSLIQTQRATASYPADSPDARQQYLDDLSSAMIRIQADWHDLLIEYAPSVLAITGHESVSGSVFSYDQKGLAINLGDPANLPMFEIKCIAAYYGYPGLQALTARKSDSITTLLDLPGYSHGWASYVVDLISEQTGNHQCLWYSRLQGATAIADLNLHRGYFDEQSALDYLHQNSPYEKSRLTGIISELTAEPGRHAALFAGRIFFRDIMAGCQDSPLEQCIAEVHQKIINFGPIPFPLLISDLSGMSGFSVPANVINPATE